MTEQELSERLDRLEQLTLIGAKQVLTLDEAVVYTGLSKCHLYRLTSTRQITFCKQARHLFFKKTDLDRWLTADRHISECDIDSEASTRLACNKAHRQRVGRN